MNRIVFTLFLVFTINLVFAQKSFYTTRWSTVYRYEIKGLTSFAQVVVDSIYARAKKENNITEFTKSLLYQAKFAMVLQEKSEVSIVNRFKKEISQSSAPQRNILESMLADVLWEYFQNNRWRYYQRTATAATVNNEDFTTWDADAMFREVHTYYQKSLQNAGQLKRIRLESLNEILALAEKSQSYRPTLYDFLAHNALDFYSKDDAGITKPAATFEISGDTYFTNFESQLLTSADSLSPKLRALKLYQDLLLFHRERKDTAAYIDVAIDQLQYVAAHTADENSQALLMESLQTLLKRFSDHEASTLVMYQIANGLYLEGERYSPEKSELKLRKMEALQVCRQAISKFANSDGAKQCQALADNILLKKLSIRTERFVPAETFARIRVEYTNLDSLHFSVYKITDELTRGGLSDSAVDHAITRSTPMASWNVGVKNLGDHHEHSTEVVIPKLSYGIYLIVGGVDKKYVTGEEIYAHSIITVTDLALVEHATARHRFQVVNRTNGNPVVGADIHISNIHNSYGRDVIDLHVTSDKNGFAEYTREGYVNDAAITVSLGVDKAMLGHYYFYNQIDAKEKKEKYVVAKPFLFTDRSIYRPGQTVYFKGILIQRENEKSSIVTGEYVEVMLEDVNGQEVSTLRLKTNSFGSFSGEFKLPQSGLTGEYTLSVDEDYEEGSKFYDRIDDFEYNETLISVEEYKRPTFETTFKPIRESFRVNDTIRVTGESLAFSGAKIGKGKVAYRVKRTVRYPRWFYSYSDYSYRPDQEIAHGITETNEKGEFVIRFKGIPDNTASPSDKPIFIYEVTADVTDLTGETRTAQTTVKLGYHTMIATIKGAEIIDRNEPMNTVSVSTENLNGEFVAAKGKIEIYKLAPLSKFPVRKRPWAAPDMPLLSEAEFGMYFPHDLYEENETRGTGNRKKEMLMHTILFDTKKSTQEKFLTNNNWPAGTYVMELSSLDSLGQPVTDSHLFELVDNKSKKVADNALFVFEMDKISYAVGETAKVKIGTAAEDVTFVVEVEKDGKIVKTYLEQLSANTKEIKIPVTFSIDNGFAVHCSAVAFNSFFTQTRSIPITPPVTSRIEIETLTFKDKIQPGGKETWSFTIKGDADVQEAELLASMYDASLDQFKSHAWEFDPVETRRYHSYNRISADNSFSESDFQIRNALGPTIIPQQYYDQFDWFGFSITDSYYARRNYLERLYSSGEAADKPSEIRISNNKRGRKGMVYGRITSQLGEPLPGVNVIIKGTTIGTVTDADGRYSVPANKDDELVFSFVGFETSEVKVGRKNTIDIKMAEDVTQLQEVVVTTHGVQLQKRALAYSVTSIAISNTTAADGEIVFAQALEGKAAGVTIASDGLSYNMRIRGNSSMDDSNKVLYVVDGVVVDNYQLEQSEVASMQVLKGSAATALYGARAANGVIVIATKAGERKMDEELAKVNARKNFNETAFFFPHLRTDETGKIRFTFTTPESLTRWKLQLLAHRKDLVTATKTLQTVTQKQLMVTPNPPRFMRVNDEIILSAKVANLTSRKLDGKIALQLTNAATGERVDVPFGNVIRNQTFTLPQKANTEVSWKLRIPEGTDALQYKIVAKAGNFSDGEQNILPVLSNRMLVTETMPLYVRSSQTKTFELDKIKVNASPTLSNHQLTLEITSNPAWYAIQSMPYLMEFPHECAEQLFSRFYANTLATHMLNSKPEVKTVFDKWASSDVLLSDLEKNEELKSILISETPWLRDAQSDEEQKKRIALFFDLNTMKGQLSGAMEKLEAMQLNSGAFPWFAGNNYPSRYITQHVASGYGHLKKLNVTFALPSSHSTFDKAVAYLDHEFLREYNALVQSAKAISNDGKADKTLTNYLDQNHLTSIVIHYLYMRSFYSDLPRSEDLKVAERYYLSQGAKYWQHFSVYLKGLIALIQFRNGNAALAQEILRSLRECAIVSEELGMYWKENVAGYRWDESPVETQALLIEAFAEIEGADPKLTPSEKTKTLDDLRLWLLKNKQTTQWKTTKATTEAIYALLFTGSEWLSLDNAVDVMVGENKLDFRRTAVEAGTGYTKAVWKGEEITKDMGKVTITKKTEGPAWGGMYWQYFEDLDKITPAKTPLTITKKLFVVANTDRGEVLTEIEKGKLKVGDLVRVRIELSSDREMEFLHMKDMRAAGLEPVNVISEYNWQDGLGYYQSTRDAATHFFFERLPKGVFVFEYDLRVNNRGNFSNGITTIQCMYAPEFTSHSEGVRVIVK